jgi:hypothetical protein
VVSDGVLFPEYAPEPRPQRPEACCYAWSEITRDSDGAPPWVWQVVHELAHGRVPFTVAQVRNMAPGSAAAGTVVRAAERGWLAEVLPETPTDPVRQYVGHLPRKR